jgi:ribosomal protein S18 acetylase RimI-like enzyme
VTVSIAFELVRPDGAAALAKLKADTFVETFAADNDPAHVEAHLAREFTPARVERTLADERSTTWWLLDDGVPVGFLKVNRAGAQTEPDLDDGLEVEQIYVLASHHGQGLGSRLMEQAITTAQSEGFPSIWLGVWEKNLRAIAVYEHLGFVPFGEHRFLFGNEEQRDVLMRLRVDGSSPPGR